MVLTRYHNCCCLLTMQDKRIFYFWMDFNHLCHFSVEKQTKNVCYASAFRRRRHYVFGLSVRPSVRLSVRPSVRPKPEIPSFDLYMGPLVHPTNRYRFTACPSVRPTSKHMYNWMKWLRLLGGWHFIAATAIKPPKAACQFAADDILLYKICYNIQWIYFTIWEKGKEELSPLQYLYNTILSLYISYQDITRRVC